MAEIVHCPTLAGFMEIRIEIVSKTPPLALIT